MHIHLSPNIPKYKRRGKIHFHEKLTFYIKLVHKQHSSIMTVCTVVTSQILTRVPRERATLHDDYTCTLYNEIRAF